MISEVDLKDWEYIGVKELYNCPRYSLVKVKDTFMQFYSVDGMYARLFDIGTSLDLMNSPVYYMAAWDKVELYGKTDKKESN